MSDHRSTYRKNRSTRCFNMLLVYVVLKVTDVTTVELTTVRASVQNAVIDISNSSADRCISVIFIFRRRLQSHCNTGEMIRNVQPANTYCTVQYKI